MDSRRGGGANTTNHYHLPIGSLIPTSYLRPPSYREVTRRPNNRTPTSLWKKTNHHRHAPEPSSPRITWTGQIKGDKSADGIGLSSVMSMFKLRRIFLCRSVVAVAAVRPHASARVRDGCFVSVDIDRPLPVMKRMEGESNSVSLWKRRCGGEALRDLQL